MNESTYNDWYKAIGEHPEVVTLKRNDSGPFQTVGELSYKEFKCYTLELPWKDNQFRVSCIPVGDYYVVKRQSPKYGNHFHIGPVPDRNLILIHSGNYVTDSKGCILVGDNLVDMNKDSLLDVTNSRNTLTKLVSILPSRFVISIE